MASAVSVLVMYCTTIGAPPPTAISPTFVWDDNLRLLEPTTATLILFVSPAKNDVFLIIHLGRTELLKYTADFG